MTYKLPGKKRKMTKFRIDEIAAVDRPAQEGARATLMKRRDPKLEKAYRVTLMTSETEGHAHGVPMYDGELGGETGWNTSEGAEQGHSHPWVVEPGTGRLIIGASEGHTHEVDQAQVVAALMILGKAKSQGGLGVPAPKVDDQPVIKENTAMDEKQLQELQARLARAEAFGELNDAEKAHFKALSPKDQESFLKMSATDRTGELAKADAANPVVYTATDGSVFRKNDDPRTVAAVKRADELEKSLKAEREANESASFAKRAETELKHFAGDVPARAALLKSVASITDEGQRKQVLEALTAANTALGKSFVPGGHQDGTQGGPADATTAEAKLDTLAKKYAADNKVPFEKAYAAVCETDEGRALYSEYVTGRPATN